jgi:hypothetical protein
MFLPPSNYTPKRKDYPLSAVCDCFPYILMVGRSLLKYRKMSNKRFKELFGFIRVMQVYPQHVSASGCHIQGVVGAFEATQVIRHLRLPENDNHLPKHLGGKSVIH